MKILVKTVYIFLSILFLIYLSFPSLTFPLPLPGSLQSNESADTEYYLRRAYFTNFDRPAVINHYHSQFIYGYFFSKYLTFKLNYPPEEAQAIIRDQTRSSYLEEIGHPFRESVFINGFVPKEQKDAIYIEGKNWLEKLTVRYVPSNTLIRTVIGLILVCFIPVLASEYKFALNDLRSVILGNK